MITISAEFVLVGVEEVMNHGVSIYSYTREVHIKADRNDVLRFEIVDAGGKVVMRGEFSLSISVDVANGGLYVVRVFDGKGKLTAPRKVIVD